MKAIIPVAGTGKNLRPLTYTQPKPLIPVAGKPIISFIIDQLRSNGVEEFVFVIGYLGEKIRDYVNEAYPDLPKEFVVQEKRKGSGHAIWKAKEVIEDASELLIFFGDTIIDMDFAGMINSKTSCLAVQEVDDPRNFGVVLQDDDEKVIGVIEKPKIPKSNLAMVGFYKIKEVKSLLAGLEYHIEEKIASEEEVSLTDGLMWMIENKEVINICHVKNWFDCGKHEILLETNARLLNREGYATDNLPSYDHSIIIHPVSIGKNCQIVDSIIGPHVSIGDNANIQDSIIKDSIIGDYVLLKEVVLKQSVIGNDTSITGGGQRLNIGDNTEIDFS